MQKPYHPPTVKRLGSLAEMTEALGGGEPDLGGQAVSTP